MPPKYLSTAAGAISVNTGVRGQVATEDLVFPVAAYTTASTPSIVSVGKRVTDQGCSFVWLFGYAPGLILANGKILVLDVDKSLPYLSKDGIWKHYIKRQNRKTISTP